MKEQVAVNDTADEGQALSHDLGDIKGWGAGLAF